MYRTIIQLFNHPAALRTSTIQAHQEGAKGRCRVLSHQHTQENPDEPGSKLYDSGKRLDAESAFAMWKFGRDLGLHRYASLPSDVGPSCRSWSNLLISTPGIGEVLE